MQSDGVTVTLRSYLTTPEIRRLIARLVLNVQHHPAAIWAWSRWRQYHQAIAAKYHRKKRTNPQP